MTSPTRDQVRSSRPRAVRALTVNMERFGKHRLELLGAEIPEQPGVDYERPTRRLECTSAERPCPYVSCKDHLYLDVTRNGAIKLNFPDLEVWELAESCALDIAERNGEPDSGIGGGNTLEDVGSFMNITRERVRQIEVRALAKLKREGVALAEFAEGLGGTKRRLPVLEDEDLEDDEEDL